jgi:hypothetical protein
MVYKTFLRVTRNLYRMSLVHVNDDSLHLIVTALCYTNAFYPLRQLQSLSLTCRRLRGVCLPFMFKFVEWPSKRMSGLGAETAKMLPEPLLPYIRHFRLTADGTLSITELAFVVPKMVGLSTFIFHTLETPSDNLVAAVLNLPSLRNLQFEETPLNFRLPETFNPDLRSLVFKDGKDLRVFGGAKMYHHSWRLVSGDDDYERLALERLPTDKQGAMRLLRAYSTSLENIEIPSELLCSLDFTSRPWPALYTLTLTGTCAPTLSLMELVRGVPGLVELHVLCSMPPAPKMAADSAVVHCSKPSPTLEQCLPRLRALTVSNLHPEDRILGDVPPTLEALVLISIHSWPDTTQGLDHCHARHILKAVSSSGARLTELRMGLDEEPSLELVRIITRDFPALEILQLGIDFYLSNREHSAHNSSLWVQYAEALSPLSALRELYLGINLPYGVLIEDYAPFFCKRLPTVSIVGMQKLLSFGYRHPPRVQWSTSYVTRGPGGHMEHGYVYQPLLV